jgi:uncharacterized membrane protein
MEQLYSGAVLGTSVYAVLWLFAVYSFLGVVVEMVVCLVFERVLELRVGLLYVPFRPLYGIGGVAYTLLLQPLVHRPVVVFVLGVLIGSATEYVAGLLMEKGFGTRSWDYRDKPLNLGGKICLRYSLCWGLLALVTIYLLNPAVESLLARLGRPVGDVVLSAVLISMLVSAVITGATLRRARRRAAVLHAGADSLTGAGRPWDRVLDRMVPDPVLINTFPRMSLIGRLGELTGQQRAWIRLSGPGVMISGRPERTVGITRGPPDRCPVLDGQGMSPGDRSRRRRGE